MNFVPVKKNYGFKWCGELDGNELDNVSVKTVNVIRSCIFANLHRDYEIGHYFLQ